MKLISYGKNEVLRVHRENREGSGDSEMVFLSYIGTECLSDGDSHICGSRVSSDNIDNEFEYFEEESENDLNQCFRGNFGSKNYTQLFYHSKSFGHYG